jgi:hypothetical protein
MKHLDIHKCLSESDAIQIAGNQVYSKNSNIPANGSKISLSCRESGNRRYNGI